MWRERKATDASELTTLIRPLPITRAALLTGETPSHVIIAALRPVAPVAIPAEIRALAQLDKIECLSIRLCYAGWLVRYSSLPTVSHPVVQSPT